ncbi:hypothetical protein Tco_0282459 [Tanacetum coccineum]
MAIGNLSMTNFFQQIKSKVDCLANLDSSVKDSSLVTYAVNGIRSKYSDVACVIRLWEKAPTFEELWSMMLLEESDMSHQPIGQSLLHNTSSLPMMLVASTTTNDKANTMILVTRGMVFLSYGMSSSYLPQATMLPQAFQIMTLQELNWNMDTGAFSYLEENTGLPDPPTSSLL